MEPTTIMRADLAPKLCLESFTSFPVVVFVELDFAELHGREDSLPWSGGGDSEGKRSPDCLQINLFPAYFCSSEPPDFHLCNPNHPYITDICVTQRDIQFQRNYRPYPIAATSPSAVPTLNHKTRVSSVPTLILTGSNVSVPTKSF